MMAYTDITGLAGVAFTLGVMLSGLPVVARLAVARFWLVAAIMALALLPISGLSIAGYVRGVLGDLSVTSLLLLGWACRAPKDESQRGSLLLGVLVLALLLYPWALGIGSFDPYRLGYGSLYLLVGLMAAALLCWLRRYTLIALAIALSVLVWAVGGYESANLWDYLLDPWLSIYALLQLILRRGAAAEAALRRKVIEAIYRLSCYLCRRFLERVNHAISAVAATGGDLSAGAGIRSQERPGRGLAVFHGLRMERLAGGGAAGVLRRRCDRGDAGAVG